MNYYWIDNQLDNYNVSITYYVSDLKFSPSYCRCLVLYYYYCYHYTVVQYSKIMQEMSTNNSRRYPAQSYLNTRYKCVNNQLYIIMLESTSQLQTEPQPSTRLHTPLNNLGSSQSACAAPRRVFTQHAWLYLSYFLQLH